MAATVTNRTRTLNRLLTTTKIEPAANYATGGVAVTANNLGLSRIDEVIGCYVDGAGYHATYDHGTGKVMLFVPDASAETDAAMAEVANDTDVTSLDIYVVAVGR